MAFHGTVHVRAESPSIHFLVASCVAAAQKAKLPAAEIEAFLREQRQHEDYVDVLECCRRWFSVR